VVTRRFGVRPYANGGSDSYFEVFDRMTGAAVASGMSGAEAEVDARRRNDDTSSPPVLTVRLDPAELAALRAAIDAVLARAGDHSRILVAQAAEALDGLRAQLAHADNLIAEQQARFAELYKLFTGWEGAST
jgi:hypothetical protein